MKLKLILFSWLFSSLAIAQIPDGYYDGTDGIGERTLKSKLSEIITEGHEDKGYGGLWTGYQTTDRDYYYENDGTILDYYSENPNGADPYEFTVGSDQCGTYSGESSCYNREHIVPQSLFSYASPMKNDIHFVRPTDGKVNGMRGHLPFGVVGSASWTSQNGSKVGTSSSTGYSEEVFEPIDEFKGDVARMVFYFVTRYENQISSFKQGDILGTSAYPGLKTWELNQLITWHNQDPVSDVEEARNNASYDFQGNRNPFIDHPEFVNAIWGTPDNENPTAITDLVATNPTSSSIDLSWTAATDNVGVTSYEVYMDGALKTSVSGTSTTISGLSANTTYTFYIIAKDAAGNSSEQSNTATETTLDGSTGGGTGECSQTEDFENIPTDSSSSYNSRTWTNNGITWTATRARTDQSINGKTIVTKSSATVTSSTISDGISSLTLTTQRFFSGGEGNLIIKINGTEVGTIPYTDEVQTTTISDINVSGDFIMLIENSDGDRVGIDDLTWNCYSSMSTQDLDEENDFRLYPNPVSHGSLYVSGSHLEEVKSVSIFNMNGQLVKKIINPFIQGNQIDVSSFAKGVYVIKFDQQVKKFMVK